jgi:TrpR-related protein YerC/YecD
MARVDSRKVNFQDRMKYLDLFWTSVSELKTREEVKNFFKDLLSESESIMLSRRIMIAKYLLEDKSYEEISEILGAGRTTISNVHNWLVSGFHGYENAIKKFGKIVDNRLLKIAEAKSAPPSAYSFSWLKRKYPLHFLLFNLIEKK